VSEQERFQPEEILRPLVEADVRFVLIGGLAAQVHGSPSMTRDVDVVPAWDGPNLTALASVLVELGAIRHDLPPDAPPLPPVDERTLREGAVFTLLTRFGRLDLLANPDPGIPFERLVRTAVTVRAFDVRLLVASLDDLIEMKRAAGRPKDRVELEILGALREELDRSPS
jgi:hypothetical protein